MTTTTLRSIRDLGDSELAALVSGDDDYARDAAIAEVDRREAAARKAQARRRVTGIAAEWREAAYADFALAERATNGYLLSPAGEGGRDNGPVPAVVRAGVMGAADGIGGTGQPLAGAPQADGYRVPQAGAG